MDGKEIRLTDSEWEIYECLWESSPLTLAQIRKRYAERTGQSRSTAETMVSRMEKKGLFRVERGERAKLYSLVVARGDAARRETRSLLRKVYGGSPALLMSAMAEPGEFTDEELDELSRILEEARERRNG